MAGPACRASCSNDAVRDARPGGHCATSRPERHRDHRRRHAVRLVAGRRLGPFKNYSLYYITSDHGTSFGCTTGVTQAPFGPIVCTGPSNDHNAEWPAITTNGKPIAGPGVRQSLLSRVYRKGVGWQVTYAGHPLYLFDNAPAQVTGEGWFEPGIPPWHGVWWLLSPSGQPVPWAGTLTTTKIGGKKVLAESYLTGGGWVNFPVYTFSDDQYYGTTTTCGAIAACARAWPQVLTNDQPGTRGVPASGADEITLPGGLRQVTWYGQPLYLFSNEHLQGEEIALAEKAGDEA